MAADGMAVFDSAIGPCGVAWSAAGICAVQLPDGDATETLSRLKRRCPTAAASPPPPGIAEAISNIQRLLEGEPTDLSSIAVDLRGVPAFDRRVYELARTIPAGETLEYGEIARRLGDAGAAQAVGRALARNPCAIVVPCHRVLAAGGRAGGFSATGGVWLKLRMLEIERSHRPFELS